MRYRELTLGTPPEPKTAVLEHAKPEKPEAPALNPELKQRGSGGSRMLGSTSLQQGNGQA